MVAKEEVAGHNSVLQYIITQRKVLYCRISMLNVQWFIIHVKVCTVCMQNINSQRTVVIYVKVEGRHKKNQTIRKKRNNI